MVYYITGTFTMFQPVLVYFRSFDDSSPRVKKCRVGSSSSFPAASLPSPVIHSRTPLPLSAKLSASTSNVFSFDDAKLTPKVLYFRRCCYRHLIYTRANNSLVESISAPLLCYTVRLCFIQSLIDLCIRQICEFKCNLRAFKNKFLCYCIVNHLFSYI